MGIKVFYKVIGMIMKTWRAWWWAWSSILKVLKATSLQCLYNISKKKLWMEFILEFIKINTSTNWIINFLWKPDMSKVPNKGSLLNFCNILRKSIATAFVFYFDAKHSDTLWGSSHVCCYSFLGGYDQKWPWPFRSWNSETCLSQGSELIKWADFFAYWYKFRKANVILIIIERAWSKMGKTFRSYRTLKSGSSHIWFDQSRSLIQ